MEVITYYQVGDYLIKEVPTADWGSEFTVKNLVADDLYEEMIYGWQPFINPAATLQEVVGTIYPNSGPLIFKKAK